MAETIDGVKYDSPLREFYMNSIEDRDCLYVWKEHFKKLKIRTLEKTTAPGRTTLYVNKEDNERMWNSPCKCGNRIIKPPSPYFGESLDKGSKEKYGEGG